MPLAAGLALLLAVPGGANGLTPPTGPSHCAAKSVRAALVEFTVAFDRGDQVALNSLFATAPDFQWYTTPGPGRKMLKGRRGRAALIPYFERRHAKHDHLRLESFSFNGNSPHWGNFDFRMRRSAEGYRGGRPFRQGGKGAAICDSAGIRFIVITFGTAGSA